jgi:hypothetical protein
LLGALLRHVMSLASPTEVGLLHLKRFVTSGQTSRYAVTQMRMQLGNHENERTEVCGMEVRYVQRLVRCLSRPKMSNYMYEFYSYNKSIARSPSKQKAQNPKWYLTKNQQLKSPQPCAMNPALRINVFSLHRAEAIIASLNPE